MQNILFFILLAKRGWMDGWMYGWLEVGYIDKWMFGWLEERKSISYYFRS